MTENENIPDLPPVVRQSMLDQLVRRTGALPWWAILLVMMFIIAGFFLLRSEEHRDIIYAMLDRPSASTQDRFDSVYEVDTEVIVLAQTLIVILPDEARITINAADVVSREQGTLQCDHDANPDCINQFGELVTFRSIVPEGATPDGTIQREGLLRPIGGIVELPDGELIFVEEDAILTEIEGTLQCDRFANADCEDLSGNIATFEWPYVLQIGLLARDDVLIQHPDGYQEVIRPVRIGAITTEACQRESEPLCFQGELKTATFRERVIGTEVGREGGLITVRTVNEESVFIPRDRIIDIDMGTVECDQNASPRCENFEGTIIERAGAITSGELTIENNRALNVIPEGQATSVEVRKSDIVSDERTPENCRVEDEGACRITVIEGDSIVAGRITADTDEGITVQTVAPVFVEIDRDASRTLRRAPLACALNNPRGCNAGIWLTLLVTFVAYGMALVIGLFVGLMRVSTNPLLYHPATFYVELIRGTPLLVLLLFFAFVIGPLIRDTDYIGPIPIGWLIHPPYDFANKIEVAILGEESFLSEAVLGLAIGYAAFLAEVFRAGIESIGRGQMEAARSLGMSYPQAMRTVILPQAIRVVLPPLGNDFIAMLKDSALISVLALPDLLQSGRLYITRTFQPIPVYIVVALLYVLMTLFLSTIIRSLEKRFKLP
jgi:polar amino acid transport system permease protein